MKIWKILVNATTATTIGFIIMLIVKSLFEKKGALIFAFIENHWYSFLWLTSFTIIFIVNLLTE